MRYRCLVAVLAGLSATSFAEQTDHSGWQYDAVMPDHLSDTAAPQAADINAINDLLSTLRDGWNAHNVDVYMSGYWNSPQLLVVLDTEQYQGWKAVYAAYKTGNPDLKAMGQMEYTRIQIRISKPDLALVQTAWKAKYPNSSAELTGTTTFNIQKVEQGWKVVTAYSRYVHSTSRGWEYDSIEPATSTSIPSPQEDAIKAINGTLLKMLDRWNAHDIDGYLSAYWNSPELLVIVQEEQYQGWQSLNDAYKSGYPDPNAMGFSQPSRIQIKLVRPDLAVVVTWWTVSYSNSKVHVVGNTTMDLQKFPDAWKIVMSHSSIAEP
jgi:ketosteroid isomerase-like protein